jgi:hypothetical protein
MGLGGRGRKDVKWIELAWHVQWLLVLVDFNLSVLLYFIA